MRSPHRRHSNIWVTTPLSDSTIVLRRVSFPPQNRQSWFEWSLTVAILSARNRSMGSRDFPMSPEIGLDWVQLSPSGQWRKSQSPPSRSVRWCRDTGGRHIFTSANRTNFPRLIRPHSDENGIHSLKQPSVLRMTVVFWSILIPHKMHCPASRERPPRVTCSHAGPVRPCLLSLKPEYARLCEYVP